MPECYPTLDQPARIADGCKTIRYRSRQKKRTMPPRLQSRTITFSLPPEMFREVQQVKDTEGRDMSELVRGARLERLRSRHDNQSVEDGGHIDE